jgi:serine phosphatase RsbU (regulator of sigma subunit)/catechol 2,3-dioxygenase-like lactoylglutathione lyase family enzyme
MASPSPLLAYRAHRCSFHSGRTDPYTRLGAVTVFVGDHERSLHFYRDQLGFAMAFDTDMPSGGRWLAVAPPDGAAVLTLVVPAPGSEESRLIGRSTHVTFLTEDVVAKYEEWRKQGVRFLAPPRSDDGTVSACFEDPDGNVFTLLCSGEMLREIEDQRRAHAEREKEARHAVQEMELARQVQSRLFPQGQPELRTLDIAGVCAQARHVGGDYYDFLDLGHDRLGLVIGDVSGKGTAAALLMAGLQAHLHNQCATYWSRPFTPFAVEQPERLLRSINHLFCQNAPEGSYATLFFAEYDDNERRLRYGNCGHPSAVLLRRNNQFERLDSTATVVGLFKEWTCPVKDVELLPGDVLALYTDGATEAFDHSGAEFGESRLMEALYRNRDMCSRELVSAVISEVRRFNPEEQHDDITLAVCKCRG